MTPLRLLILSDGRPGHFNLSEGIAAAVERLRPVDITRIDVRRGGWPGAVLAAAANGGAPAAAMLRLVYGLDPAELPTADLIVSAGAETLAANVWLARLKGIPNVFYGSLRAFRPTDFALVLTSYARNAGRPNHAVALKPSRLDPDTLALPPGCGPQDAGLIIGGDAGTFSYAPGDWDRLIEFAEAMHAERGTRWHVSNSRRTPDAVSNRLTALARAKPAMIGQWIDIRQPDAARLPALLAGARWVLCTDDSSSMVSECIWARRPVIGVTPVRWHHTVDEAQYRAWLSEQGWCRSLPIGDLSPDRVDEELAPLKPLARNPLDALAELLAERIEFPVT